MVHVLSIIHVFVNSSSFWKEMQKYIFQKLHWVEAEIGPPCFFRTGYVTQPHHLGRGSTLGQLFCCTWFQFCLFGVKRVKETAKSSPSQVKVHMLAPNSQWYYLLLAHLSRRLARWAYSIPMVCRPSSVCCCFQTWISLKLVGQSLSNFMCSSTGVGERPQKVLGQIGSKLWFPWQ